MRIFIDYCSLIKKLWFDWIEYCLHFFRLNKGHYGDYRSWPFIHERIELVKRPMGLELFAITGENSPTGEGMNKIRYFIILYGI